MDGSPRDPRGAPNPDLVTSRTSD